MPESALPPPVDGGTSFIFSPPEEDVGISQRLTRYGVPDTEHTRDIYRKAVAIGRGGLPVTDMDLTNISFQLSALRCFSYFLPGATDYFLRFFRTPLRYRNDAAFNVPNRWGYGRQAMLLGLTDGAGKTLRVDSRGYPFRLASIAYHSPSFAKSLLGIEPEELYKLHRQGPELGIQELARRVSEKTSIFTWESLREAAKRSFAQYTKDPKKMTEAQWLTVLGETKNPGSSGSKEWFHHEAAGKLEVRDAMLDQGLLDDKLKSGRAVTTPDAKGRAVILGNPPGLVEFILRPDSDEKIHERLKASSTNNQTWQMLEGIEQMRQAPKGKGEKSMIKLSLPEPLTPEYDTDTHDKYDMRQPATRFLKEWWFARGACRTIMANAHLDGATPTNAWEQVRRTMARGGFSVLEMGASTVIAKAVVGNEIDWKETAIHSGITAGAAGLAASLFGANRFYRGAFGNIITGVLGSTVIQLYEGEEVTPFSNLIAGLSLATVHSVVYRFITQPLLIQKMGALAVSALKANQLTRASRLLFGLRAGTGLAGFAVSTLISIGFEYLAYRQRAGLYEHMSEGVSKEMITSYLDYRKEQRSEEAYGPFKTVFEDPDLPLYLAVGDYPDIEGKHFMKASSQLKRIQDKMRVETDDELIEKYGVPMNPSTSLANDFLMSLLSGSSLYAKQLKAEKEIEQTKQALRNRLLVQMPEENEEIDNMIQGIVEQEELPSEEDFFEKVAELSGKERVYFFAKLLIAENLKMPLTSETAEESFEPAFSESIP